MSIKKALFAWVLAVLVLEGITAQNTTGRISYLEGRVDITRNGKYLDPADIEIGISIEEFDTLETAADGYAEVELNAPSEGSLIKVQPGTSFYFSGTESNTGKRQTLFQMLRGSLSLKIAKLRSRESFEVQTDSAVMAVRGTEFNVDMATDRSILVSVPEGRVETYNGRQTAFAEPGIITTVDNSARISNVSVKVDDIDFYREYWRGLRLDALKINARLSIQSYAAQWDKQLPRLRAAMRETKKNQAIFTRWESVMKGDVKPPGLGDTMRDKMAISRGMIELRAALPLAERSYYTLDGLKEAYDQGFAAGAFGSGNYRDAAHFYNTFEKDSAEMRAILAESRWYIRIYNYINR